MFAPGNRLGSESDAVLTSMRGNSIVERAADAVDVTCDSDRQWGLSAQTTSLRRAPPAPLTLHAAIGTRSLICPVGRPGCRKASTGSIPGSRTHITAGQRPFLTRPIR